MAEDIERLIIEYRTVRDGLNAERGKWKELEAKYKGVLDSIEVKLLQLANEQGVDSFKTQAGTAFKKVTDFVNIRNWEIFLPWAIDQDMTQMLGKKVAKTAVTEFMEANENRLPPGLEYGHKIEMQVRGK